MNFLDFTWYYIVVFLVTLTVLVFVHELGHYWVARRNGVRVEVFSIGFGPEIYGWTDRAGTRWKFSAIPLGGVRSVTRISNRSSAATSTSDRAPNFDESATTTRLVARSANTRFISASSSA